MTRKVLYIICLLQMFWTKTEAQISPGDLSRSHAQLEGMMNCTQCHVIGEKVSNEKCLNCHKEIKTRIDKSEGYHASKDVKGKDCAKCHSDHHGRNFDMVRFDEKNFNHNLTGYTLAGAHQKIDCRQCHKPDFIDEPALKKRKESYLGLSQKCNNCHTDYHQKTLGNDCAKCHNNEAFVPASKFDHDKAAFALAGKHKSVDCKACHQMETRNGSAFQKFAGIDFKNCNSCHSDIHKNNLGQNCKECHNELAFSNLSTLHKFNHSRTNFTLKGKHRQADCAQCHQMKISPAAIFQDRLGVKTNECATCHQDVHEGKFGSNCSDCHNENSFHEVSKMENFDHDLTDFALEGRHQAVDCKKCHTQSFTTPVTHNACAACHADFHEGQFSRNDKNYDCKKCHSVEGFEESLFGIEEHRATKFPLEGGHAATPCFACHLKEEKWQFAELGSKCADCHQDIHAGQISEKYYPQQDCAQCHVPQNWQENHFDHNKTPFQLLGIHVQQKCTACHMPDEQHKQGKFIGLSGACAGCHQNVHGDQFEVNGQTDCARCHGFESWNMENFDHDKARFKLEGKHKEVACDKCHRKIENNGNTLVQYKFKQFECIDCHQ